MGSRFEITAVAETEAQAWNAVEAGIDEIKRIEKLISSWDPNSQTSAINESSGMKAVSVDPELYELIRRALSISEITDGAFDISFAAMERIYSFDKGEHPLPDSLKVALSKEKVDFRKVAMNAKNSSVFLKEKGMRIGFGAMGKGYAANKAAALMKHMPGIKGGVVNASGDLLAWGQSTTAEGWQVKIADPKEKNKIIAWLSAQDLAVVTSGNYEKYFLSGGQRYAHIIDPRTGYPCTGISSVTIVCPDAELADALATSIFVMGVEDGLELINAMDYVECLIIDDSGKLHTSNQLKLNRS